MSQPQKEVLVCRLRCVSKVHMNVMSSFAIFKSNRLKVIDCSNLKQLDLPHRNLYSLVLYD